MTNTLKGRTYEEIYGAEKALELRELRSKQFKGKVFSEEHRKNLSESHKGKERSEETRKKISENAKINPNYGMKGKSHSQETRLQIQMNNNGKHYFIHSEKSKRQMRISAIERMGLNDNKAPNYNKEACEFFKSFDEQNNTQGKYALYGGGEYHIKELGYFVDYFNLDLKLIMEFDEPKHYEINGNLKKRDKIRQQEIQNCFPDYEFRRIKQ